MRHKMIVSWRAATCCAALILLCGLTFSGVVGASIHAQTVDQGASNVPTLVPPTLVPTVETGLIDALLSESAVARIQREGVVRVGLLYNEPPFGELNIRGELTGFDADLARSIAETWEVELEIVQVTRQTGVDMLQADRVDMLMGLQIHNRVPDPRLEFSHTYHRGSQSMIVRNDDGASVLGHMENRVVGTVMGTRSGDAVADWLRRSDINVTVNSSFLTLDQAFVALMEQEIDGVVGSHTRLMRVMTANPGITKFVEEIVQPEPYAVAVRRQDVNMRNLVNKTLQFLDTTGRMAEIHQAHFPSESYPDDLIAVWHGIDEEAPPKPSQFGTGVPYPARYVTPRIQAGETVRVAGMPQLPDDPTESQRILHDVHRQVVERMADRWGVEVEFINSSSEDAVRLVANGEAEMALGVEADWAFADQVDFTNGYYLLHGYRLMVPFNSNIETFNDLRTTWVATFVDEEGAVDRVNELAESVNVVSINFFQLVNEEDAVFAILESNNADVVFGDSLKLMPHVRQNPEDVRLTERWYSQVYTGFAVPRNDLDFRRLVEYTLQEMSIDGTLNEILSPAMLNEEMPRLEIWPGPTTYLNFDLTG